MKSVFDTTEKFKFVIFAFVAVLFFIFFAYAYAETVATENMLDSSAYTSSPELKDEENIIPYGAPDTGFGGSTQLEKMDANAALPLLALVLILLVGFGVLYAFVDGKRGKNWV